MRIEVLGETGNRSDQLVNHVCEAVARLGRRDLVIRVRDPDEIAARGVWKTPALAVNGQIEIIDAVPATDDLVALFTRIQEKTENVH